MTNQLLDQIFHDADTKYKLDLFKPEERNQLQLFEKEGKIRVRCKVRDRDFVAKPEEVVRQLVINHLHYTLRYPLSQMKVEVQVLSVKSQLTFWLKCSIIMYSYVMLIINFTPHIREIT